MTNEVARLNSLLKEAKRQLPKDEVIALFDLTRKRIRKLEQKAVLLLYAKRRNPKPEKARKNKKSRRGLDNLAFLCQDYEYMMLYCVYKG